MFIKAGHPQDGNIQIVRIQESPRRFLKKRSLQGWISEQEKITHKKRFADIPSAVAAKHRVLDLITMGFKQWMIEETKEGEGMY